MSNSYSIVTFDTKNECNVYTFVSSYDELVRFMNALDTDRFVLMNMGYLNGELNNDLSNFMKMPTDLEIG